MTHATWLGLLGLAACDPGLDAPGAPAPTASTGGIEAEADTGTSTTPDAVGDDGSTGAAVELPEICRPYLDEPERALELRITNRTDEDLLLFDYDGCGSIVTIWQLRTADGGAWPLACGQHSPCATRMQLGCVTQWCNLPCSSIGGIRLPPDATYTERFEGRIAQPTELPAACNDACEVAECNVMRALAPDEPAELVLRTSPAPRCLTGPPPIHLGPCECQSLEADWCVTSSLGAEVVDEWTAWPATITHDAVEVVIFP